MNTKKQIIVGLPITVAIELIAIFGMVIRCAEAVLS